ncbi:phosphotransferase [Mucilaginibacter gotjawali]|uniref:Ser/Thr protein kinase RdoA (MazF antagonist) n=1 Tax=Mucilaginibacter gotjawali TaxID=1550579 RepID=A0A839SKT8_9SPHI|nr:phosphotransferase [Mucilaginibacter gotjawali]MBB3058895.1 Ser/Thr protein kinase RdoA (MazF antagonist) [Mucilaginibacter gotjawali]
MLSVINSTFSPFHLGSFIRQQYNLRPDTVCTLLKTGINDSFLINDGASKFVYRVYSLNWRTRSEILEEIRLLNLLHSNHVPVSYPLLNIHGEYIEELKAPEGLRFGVLFTFAKGEKLLNFPIELHYQTGVIMAGMHRLTNGIKLGRVSYSAEEIMEDSFEQLKKFLPSGTAEMDFMVSAQKYLLDEFAHFDESQLRKGAVHMDIWFDNISIDQEAGITLFDFDFCGNGWLCYDVAYYILQLNSTEKDDAECKLKTEAFLNGYESVTGLTAEERRIIPHLGVALYFFYLGIQCRRFDNWSNTFLNEMYLKRFINLLVKRYFKKNGLG